jgi:hypothetical protein
MLADIFGHAPCVSRKSVYLYNTASAARTWLTAEYIRRRVTIFLPENANSTKNGSAGDKQDPIRKVFT